MTSYPRSRVLNFRLTELEYLEVKRSAEAQGSRCVSDFARRSLLKNSREAAVANRLESMFRDLQNRISVLDSQMFRLIGVVQRDESADTQVLVDEGEPMRESRS